MSGDDEIAAALPAPPPPAPVRREAAIAEAMRRFDGGEARPADAARPVAPRPVRRWRIAGLPQTGVLVSAALVALIAVPVGLMSFGPNGPQTETAAGPVDSRRAPASKAVDLADADPGVVGSGEGRPSEASIAEKPVTSPPPVVAPPPLAPPAAVADRSASAPAAPPGIVASAPMPMGAVENRAALSQDRREEKSEALAMNDAEPRVRTPAVRPAEAERFREVDESSIIVTGTRRSRARAIPRGDWNACTVTDPQPRLDRCRRLVDPGAKGPAGVAAARVADGLSQAWAGDISQAIDAFDTAIAADPRSAFAYLNRGLARARDGDLDRAIADLDQSARLAPRSARVFYNRSVLLRQRGDTRRARDDEQRAVDLDDRYQAVVP